MTIHMPNQIYDALTGNIVAAATYNGGDSTFRYMMPGTYTMRAEKEGFKQLVSWPS
jgi:hypothetical protein